MTSIDVATYTAIAQLQRAYADISTRGAWGEAASVFTPGIHVTFHTWSGGVFEVESADAFAAFGDQMTDRYAFFEYFPMNFVVWPEGGGNLGGRTYSLEVGEERKSGAWIESFSTYEDEYRKHDGAWRFARRAQRTVMQRVTPKT
jgi:hypothetical protein